MSKRKQDLGDKVVGDQPMQDDESGDEDVSAP